MSRTSHLRNKSSGSDIMRFAELVTYELFGSSPSSALAFLPEPLTPSSLN